MALTLEDINAVRLKIQNNETVPPETLTACLAFLREQRCSAVAKKTKEKSSNGGGKPKPTLDDLNSLLA